MEVDGVTRVVSAGELVSSDDPVYTRKTRGHFEDLVAHVDQRSAGRAAAVAGGGVEQATAAPGEKRDVQLPAPYDPSEHNVAEVTEYLKGVDKDEAARVLDAEAAAPNPRKGVLALREQLLADEPEPSDTPPADPDE